MQVQINRFLLRAGGFSLPILLLLGFLEYQQQILPNNYTAKHEYLMAIKDSVTGLVLGNSQAYMGVDPHVMSGHVFNLSNTAQTLPYDFDLLRTYVDSLPKLRTVYLGISYPSLFTRGNDLPGDFNRTYHYKHFLGLSIEADPSSPRYYSAVSNYSVRRSVGRTLDYHFRNDPLVEFDSLGWYTDSVQRDLDRNGIDACRFHCQYMSMDHRDNNLQYLERLSSLCQQHDIRLILFTPPAYHSYRMEMDSSYYRAMVASMNEFSASHGLDYINLFESEDYLAEDFFDSNHLREQGAVKMSLHLDSLGMGVNHGLARIR